MDFTVEQTRLPLRIRTEHRMTGRELLAFCAANEPARVERQANGELIVISPTFSEC